MDSVAEVAQPEPRPAARTPSRAKARTETETAKGRAKVRAPRRTPAAPPLVPGPIGQVSTVHIYPLKSASAPAAATVTLRAAGAIGDRWYAVVDADSGQTLTMEEAPELRSVSALLALDGAPVLQVEGAPPSLRGERADAALSALLGRNVRIAPLPRDASRLEAPVHLISVQSLAAARRGEHAVADCACSVEEPRANLVLDLEAGDERALVGRRIRVGQTVLRIARTPQHCLGVYAEVDTDGAVVPGDPVELLDGGPVEPVDGAAGDPADGAPARSATPRPAGSRKRAGSDAR